jgi:hypothetical protein
MKKHKKIKRSRREWRRINLFSKKISSIRDDEILLKNCMHISLNYINYFNSTKPLNIVQKTYPMGLSPKKTWRIQNFFHTEQPFKPSSQWCE